VMLPAAKCAVRRCVVTCAVVATKSENCFTLGQKSDKLFVRLAEIMYFCSR
jgi:hypothetical protein